MLLQVFGLGSGMEVNYLATSPMHVDAQAIPSLPKPVLQTILRTSYKFSLEHECLLDFASSAPTTLSLLQYSAIFVYSISKIQMLCSSHPSSIVDLEHPKGFDRR